MRFTRLSDLRGQLLESPVWDAQRGCLFLVDIEPGLVHRVGLDGRRDSWDMGDKAPSLGLTESGRLVVALSRSVILFDPDTGAREVLVDSVDLPETSRLNDGKVGPDGAFWVGSMDGRAEREPISGLYRVTATGIDLVIDGGIKVSNGLAWSSDGRQMFWSDSRGPWIDLLDFDPELGSVSNRRRIRDLDQATGTPDGGACDTEGHYWSAGVSAGVLNRFAPDGTLVARHAFPAPAPTMPCFCGPDLRQLAVTSHRYGQSPEVAHPLAGALFLADAPVAGVPVARMKGV